MASPITVGVVAIVVAPINKKRAAIKFQNTSPTQIIYIKKIPLSGAFSTVSATDYEFKLSPLAEPTEGAESFETNSIASFMAISSAAGGILAIYETQYV